MSTYRDSALLQKMVLQVRTLTLCRPLLLAVDGPNTYVTVLLDAFRTGIPRLPGQTRRMTLVFWPNISLVQVIKPKRAEIWDIRRVIV